MIEIEIPGFKVLQLAHLVLDYNGTLAVNGELIQGVKSCLNELASNLGVHVVTADTFGKAAQALDGLDGRLVILPPGNQSAAKADYVRRLGGQATVAIGNGRNDRLMLEQAALGCRSGRRREGCHRHPGGRPHGSGGVFRIGAGGVSPNPRFFRYGKLSHLRWLG